MIKPAGPPIILSINEPSMVGESRRTATSLAGRLGFDETGRGRVALVATEAATNLHKHAGGGEILLQGLEDGAVGGVEILALDRGPGMADVARCLGDGYSTAGSSGTGLGAMQRLVPDFDIHSGPGIGSVVLARLWADTDGGRREAPALQYGAVSVPLAGEEVCGDSWAIEHVAGRSLVMVVDGLGHGPQAADAAREAVRVFGLAAATVGPADYIREAHAALRSTRGAALAVAQIDHERGEVRYAGVGNIAGAVLDANHEVRTTHMVSHNGTVGHTIRKVQEFSYAWSPGSLLVMHSDGLVTHWQLDHRAGLRVKHPGVAAGSLYRDFKRGRDDVTIVVARGVEAGRR
ncbi:ATP-binding SpoIIE family protein phosphatase [Aquisphaera insulae]|uniref:ATP-binding SpoIIE family protein phosphatase n=1 Tax=Aquisphaera insulae TaxID=2712864 RepID=UPI00202FB3DC|nr:ATP-binding SpoIIE family protein phosphatase [Aquisphaera insulae]